MASVYTNDLRLEEIGSGEQSGSWGDTTNTNLELIAEAFAFGTEAITTNADTHATTIADGATDPGRALFLKYTGSLDSTCTITLGPNTVSKVWFIENATTGSSVDIIISQGSGANVTIPNGHVKAIYSNGAGSGAVVTDAFAGLSAGANLYVKNPATVDNSPANIYLQTAEADIAVNDVLGKINFQAPDETSHATGDNKLVAAAIQAISEGDFSQTNNATSLAFMTAASEAATTKMTLSSLGNLTLTSTTASTSSTTGSLIVGGGVGIADDLYVGTDLDVTGNAVIDGTALVTGVLTTTAAAVFNGGFAANDGSTITTADNSVQLTLKSTDADESIGPLFVMKRDSSSPAADDQMGKIRFVGEDSTDAEVVYSEIVNQIKDPTNNSEDGRMAFNVMSAGTGASFINMTHSGVQAETVFNEESRDIDFRVESNNLANMLFVNAAEDKVFIGHNTTHEYDAYGAEIIMQIEAAGTAPYAGIGIIQNSNDTDSAPLIFGKSRGTSVGSTTIVQDDDLLGRIEFQGMDGADLETGASIFGMVDGTPGSNDMPGRLTFNTTASGANSATERMRIDSSGNIIIANTGGTLYTATAGSQNLRLGENAGDAIADGALYNTVVGGEAGTAITTGDSNTALGFESLKANTTASYNTAVGYQAGYANTTGDENFYGGNQAGYSATGSNNVGIGQSALRNTTSSDNVAVGHGAMVANTSGAYNVAVGAGLDGVVNGALSQNTTGSYNTALGNRALYTNTTASNNTAVGYQAGYANTTGERNTSVGTQSLYTNTTGSFNSAYGRASMYYNTTGQQNAAFGQDSLFSNTTGSYNVALGKSALETNTTASSNTAVGYQAGYSNATGAYLTATGYFALKSSTADGNTAMGWNAAGATTSGNYNTAQGFSSLATNSTGAYNTALGASALSANTTASNNTAVGYQSLYDNTTGANNQAVGNYALSNNTTGSSNQAMGYAALEINTTGANNVAIGSNALLSNTTASNNTALGFQAGYTQATSGDSTYLGYQAGYSRTGSGNTCIGNYSGRDGTTGTDNTLVGRNSGYTISSGSKNTIIGMYNGNQHSLDIRTSSNNIVLSDGDGNPRVIVDSSGNTYLGGATSGSAPSYYFAPDSGGGAFKSIKDSTNARTAFEFHNPNGTIGSITTSGSSTAYNTSSDHRLKENVVYDWDATTRLKQLKPARFNFIADAGTTVDGFLAHEAQAVVPEAVHGTHNEVDADGNAVMQGIDQAKLVPLLVKTIQELEARITALESA